MYSNIKIWTQCSTLLYISTYHLSLGPTQKIRNLLQLMLEKQPILRAKSILLFTVYILLNSSETGHMTENKVVPEKQMQSLLICLCKKAVGIHGFYLFYLHVISQKHSLFSSRNSFKQKFETKLLLVEKLLSVLNLISQPFSSRLRYTQKLRLPSEINKFIAAK